MDSFSRDNRERHLITRGNVDGIVSAALFLHVHPDARVTFVTSPGAAAKALSLDEVSTNIYLSDLAMVPELESSICKMSQRTEVLAFDHHQPHPNAAAVEAILVVREGMSAASVMYHHFRLNGEMRKLVAIADLVEYCDTQTLSDEIRLHGMEKLQREAIILDFSWRLDIDDDYFRAMASAHLSQGIWPSEVSAIRRRYLQVMNEQRWPKALARVRGKVRVRGPAAVLLGRDKNRSLYGFGTRALVEVAKVKGCQYAVMVNERKQHSSVSMRSLEEHGVNLGRFVEEFTMVHGLEGGGHPASAGARIPVEETDRFLDEFIASASR